VKTAKLLNLPANSPTETGSRGPERLHKRVQLLYLHYQLFNHLPEAFRQEVLPVCQMVFTQLLCRKSQEGRSIPRSRVYSSFSQRTSILFPQPLYICSFNSILDDLLSLKVSRYIALLPLLIVSRVYSTRSGSCATMMMSFTSSPDAPSSPEVFY
jgi:hypothetical protein